MTTYMGQKETEASNNANRKKFQDFQKEQANYEESINKVNSAIQKTDKILDTLPLHDKLDSQFLDMIDSVDNLNSKRENLKKRIFKDISNIFYSNFKKQSFGKNSGNRVFGKNSEDRVLGKIQ